MNGPTFVSGAVDAVTLAVPSHTQPTTNAQDQGNSTNSQNFVVEIQT